VSKLTGDPGYRASWCIHYCAPPPLFGPDANKPHLCEAGVQMEKWRGISHDKRPCFLDKRGQSKPEATSCEHLRRPTAEEIAAHEQWSKARMETMIVVMTAIQPWRAKHKGKSASDIIECPACKGRLHLSIAACNGHVHAHCETDGCVSWME
jgi:hypothetical protein